MRIYIMLFVDYHIDYFGWTTSWREAKAHLEEYKGYGSVKRLTIRADSKTPEEHTCWVWGEWKEKEAEG